MRFELKDEPVLSLKLRQINKILTKNPSSWPLQERKSINKVKISPIVSTSIYFQKPKKSFKKEAIK